MAQLSEEDAAEKAKDRLVEIQSRLYDRAAAYTNLIILGGYAGAFTIWSFTKAQLPSRATIAFALLLGVSLAVFIFFEVFKMYRNAIHFARVSSTLNNATSATDFLSKWQKVEKNCLVIIFQIFACGLFACSFVLQRR